MLLKHLIAESEARSLDPNPYQDPAQDSSVAEKPDTRKTRLTLEQIHRLRKLNDVKISEYHKNIAQIKSQYQPPREDTGGL